MSKLAANNFVVGIDPGTTQSAFVEFDGRSIYRHGILPNAELEAHELWNEPHIYCEMIACYGMAVGASVFETCVWIGRFMAVGFFSSGRDLHRVFRKDVKLHLCNSPRAKDGNVRQALIDRVGPQGTKKNQGPTYGIKSHEWAALAVAVYGWDQTFGRASGLSKINSNPPGAPDS